MNVTMGFVALVLDEIGGGERHVSPCTVRSTTCVLIVTGNRYIH